MNEKIKNEDGGKNIKVWLLVLLVVLLIGLLIVFLYGDTMIEIYNNAIESAAESQI